MDFKDYNSHREKLLLPEYGRHIQNMVHELKKIEDRDERTKQAQAVIAVMGNLNSQLRDTVDFRHKLWDHIFVLADFDLDVDSPYPIPSFETLNYCPKKIEYPSGKITYKQYGKNIRNVINLIKTFDNEAERTIVATDISKFMKYKSFEYNQEYPSDEVIIEDIRKFSDGVISLDNNSLNSTKLNTRNPGKTVNKNNPNDKGKRMDSKNGIKRPNTYTQNKNRKTWNTQNVNQKKRG